MCARDGFGYSSEGAVDGRYMPEEAVGPGEQIELTDQTQVINRAIDVAKMQERSWPTVQYLWDGHPILEWFTDRASTFFPEHSAPVASLSGRLEQGEIVVVLHGAIPNANRQGRDEAVSMEFPADFDLTLRGWRNSARGARARSA